MRARSNSLKTPRKTSSSSSITSKESFNKSEDDIDYSNSSDPCITGPSSLNQTPKRFQFKFRKMEKEDSKSSLSQQKQAKKKKNILVLDLDETLVHTIEVTPNSPNNYSKTAKSPKLISKVQWNVKLEPKIKDKAIKNKSISQNKDSNQDCFKAVYNIIHLKFTEQEFYVFERPHVREFLQSVCDLFDVYIYTAGEIPYAKPIIDSLCPLIDEAHRRYGDSCQIKYNRLYKDLYSFNCPLTDIFIVDDNPENFFFWPKNTILCKPFSFNNESDNKNSHQDEEDNDDDDSDSNSRSDSRSDSNSFIDLNDFVENYEELENNDDSNHDNIDFATFIDQNYLMERLLPVLEKCATAKDVRKVINSWSSKRLTKVSENEKNGKGIYFIGPPKPLNQ